MELRTDTGEPVSYPRRKVEAWVGAFASDYLGDFDTPIKAAERAREAGYGVVRVMYLNGESDSIVLSKEEA